MPGRRFTRLTAVSLIALAYLVLGTVQSWNHKLAFYRSRTGITAVERNGLLQFGRWQGEIITGQNRFLGFDYMTFQPATAGGDEYILDVPYWPFILLASVLPAVWIYRALGYRAAVKRAALGRCFACGYDLRATPDRCPECGTVPPAETQ